MLVWIRGWSNQVHLTPLLLVDWFKRGHGISGGSKDLDGIWMQSQSFEVGVFEEYGLLRQMMQKWEELSLCCVSWCRRACIASLTDLSQQVMLSMSNWSR